MSALDLAAMTADIFGMPPRAAAMRTTFTCWPIFTSSAGGVDRRDLAAATLDEAVKLATPPVTEAKYAKGGFSPFVILETDDTAREGKARHIAHFYNVKAKREWRTIAPHETRKMAVPYAVHAGSLAMDAFEPRRPFDAFQDHPGNGRQPGEARLIEIGAKQ